MRLGSVSDKSGHAGVASCWLERPPCKRKYAGSIPVTGSGDFVPYSPLV